MLEAERCWWFKKKPNTLQVALAVFWGAVSLPTDQLVALMRRLALKSSLLH